MPPRFVYGGLSCPIGEDDRAKSKSTPPAVDSRSASVAERKASR